ncbi:MAG: hypothetical protein H0X63_01370 [Flavobacteriales bacterium]|nr:hypothetical protein [Flavobacteriales bacterium]
MIQRGDQQEAIQNAILDFSNTSGLYKKDSVFSVSYHDPFYKMTLEKNDNGDERWIESELYEGIVAVSISADYNKMLQTDNIKVNNINAKFPTRYIERDGKLFYWRDGDYPLTQEVLNVFKRYNLLLEDDLDGVMEFYDFTTNDAQKGIDYFFCKNNLVKYKKTTTNKGIGYYDAPALKCSTP